MKSISELQKEVHELAVSKGWWQESHNRIVPEKLMLIVTELGEAMEEYRTSVSPLYGIHISEDGKPEGFAVELADAVIRILDLCGALDINLEDTLYIKHNYNKTRPYRHGNKNA